ncbi:MAG: hypothetical protein HFJ30_00290 [Clostridia bacterium]|jgi:hypothetical protein|nr:hypothetical protein [Clostridia bacterium]
MRKCKHKHHGERNVIREDYHTVEYDIYCEDCGEYLAHWAYGTVDPEYTINYELKGLRKIKAKFRYYIVDQIKAHFSNKIDELFNKNNNNLPF